VDDSGRNCLKKRSGCRKQSLLEKERKEQKKKEKTQVKTKRRSRK
jgi:hypothetical protein